MPEKSDTLVVRANVEITTTSLQAIVENAKKLSSPDERGVYRVDTADKVGEMISRFLLQRDFESFAKNIDNYSS